MIRRRVHLCALWAVAQALVAGPATSGLRVVRVDEGGFRHRWYPLADVPARLEDCKM